MNKKITAALICICVFTLFLSYVPTVFAEQSSEYVKSELLMECNTGQVLYESNGYEKVPVGTLVKVMTVLLAAEYIESGYACEDTIITASENASGSPLATIWLMPDEKMTMRDILKGIIIGNANDACIALAEHIAGNEEKFVMLMNAKAEYLGMENTSFSNCTGYDSETQYSTAYDMALLAREISKYDFLREYMTTRLDYIRDGKTELVNENSLTKKDGAVDGIKAGHSQMSGNCIITLSDRPDGEYITVVLGCSDEYERFERANALISKAYSCYQTVQPTFSGEFMKPLEVRHGLEYAVEVEAENLKGIVIPKGDAENLAAVVFLPQYINAPVRKGQHIGSVSFYIGDVLVYETDITAVEEVCKITFAEAFKRSIVKMLK